MKFDIIWSHQSSYNPKVFDKFTTWIFYLALAFI